MQSTIKNILTQKHPSHHTPAIIPFLSHLDSIKTYRLLLNISSSLIPHFLASSLLSSALSVYPFKILAASHAAPSLLPSIFNDLELLYASSPPSNYLEILRLQKSIIPHLRPLYTSYPSDIVDQIMNSPRDGDITLTITTCKRIDLFVPTMNSFLRCCKDLSSIARWIVIDDNSTQEDRDEMERLYPFCEFVYKTPDERGHPRSMNMLRSMVSTPYIFHMEDDWLFIHPAPYLATCRKVLQENPMYGQCLINRNYSETEGDLIRGGIDMRTEDGTPYAVHQYFSNREELDRFVRSARGSTVAYWPHYSFRPSLLRKEVWDIAPFREDQCHFEMEHAHLYIQRGYLSTFLPGTYSLHTGKLTSETTTKKANAYALNNTSQFGSTLSVSNTQALSLPKNKDLYEITPYLTKTIKNSIGIWSQLKKVDKYYINLSRRQDRNSMFLSRWKNVERFDAIEGDLLKFSPRVIRLWGTNDHYWNRRIMGCAYSHMILWRRLLESDCDAYLVMEDDAIPTQHSSCIDRIMSGDIPIQYDMLFMSYFETNPGRDIKDGGWVDKNAPDKLQFIPMNSFEDACTHFMGGISAYMITRSGAQKMLNMINEFGLPNAIDTMMYRLAGIGRTMFTYPPLVEAPLANYSQEVDSDIQRCARPLLGVETYVEDHAKYLMNLCSVYNYTFNRTTSMPEEIDPKGVYMMEYHDYQGSIESPQGFDHYWLDQTRTVMMPCQLRRVVEASEGWRLSKQGCFEIDGLIQG